MARLLLSLLSIIGGAAGVGVTVAGMYANPAMVPLFAVVAAAYGYGVWVGASMLRGWPGWLRRNELYWLVQVPAFTTTLVGFWFASGAYLFVYLKLLPAGVGFNAFLGSFFGFNFMRPEQPVVGLNLIALAVWLYLRRLKPDAP